MYAQLIIIVLLIAQFASCDEMTKHQLLKKLLNESTYDPSVYPYDGTGNATEVTVQLIIADVSEINDITMDLKMTLYLRMKWSDHRLNFEKDGTNITFDRLELAGKSVGRVWIPDLFFNVERDASYRGIMGDEKLIYIYQNGTVAYSERITMTAECDMNLEMFPFDTQHCPMKLESYAYMSTELILKWTKNIDNAILFEEQNTPHFQVNVNSIKSGFRDGNSEDIFDEPGKFSYLEFTLTLKREHKAYDFMYFATIPFYFMGALLSFGMNDCHNRIITCSGAVLPIIVQWINDYSRLPLSPVTTKLDSWMFVHFLMIILMVLYHFSVDLWMRTRKDRKNRNEALSKVLSQSIHLSPQNSASHSYKKWKVKEFETIATRLDCFCKQEERYIPKEITTESCDCKCCCGYTGWLVFRIVFIPVFWIAQILVWIGIILLNCIKHIVVWPFRIAGIPRTNGGCSKSCCVSSKSCCWWCINTIVEWVVKITEVYTTVYELEKNGKQEPIKRTFNDCYFLQMYLKAKYPKFGIAFDNSSEQLRLHNDRLYIEHLLNSLESDVWDRYSEIKDIRAEFSEDEWNETFYRLMTYNVFFVDSTGKKTTPDLLCFLLFVQAYCIFLPIHLVKWGCCSGWFALILIPFYALVAVIIGKYKCIRPPNFVASDDTNNQNTEMPSGSQNDRGFVNMAASVNHDETQREIPHHDDTQCLTLHHDETRRKTP